MTDFKWSLDKTLSHRLESFKALSTACSLHWNCILGLELFGAKCIIWRKILECFHQKP